MLVNNIVYLVLLKELVGNEINLGSQGLVVKNAAAAEIAKSK
jgi:hypothetical protein